MAEQVLDLFGDLVTLPSGRRGRPAHVASQENRNKVMVLLAMGWSNERISNAIRCSLPTLRKHYFSELKVRAIQRDRLDAWRLMCAQKLADEGNVAALKELGRLIEKNDQVLAQVRIDGDRESPPEGKKTRANADAEKLTRNAELWDGDLTPGSYTQ